MLFWLGLILGAAAGGYGTYLYAKSAFLHPTASVMSVGYDCTGNISCNVTGSVNTYRLYGVVQPASDPAPSSGFPPPTVTNFLETIGDGAKSIPGAGSMNGSVKAYVWMVDVVGFNNSAPINCNGGSSSSSSMASSSSSSSTNVQ